MPVRHSRACSAYRLAADAISFFTVRGLTGEPLKVVLLYDRVPPAVTAAAIAIERTAFAVMAIVVSGLVSYLAVQRLRMPGGWDAVFTLVSVGAVLLLGVLAQVARHRSGDYLGRFVARIGALTGRHLESSRVIRFILDVEDIVLDLLRGSRRRLIILTVLPIVCYGLMALEVWLVLGRWVSQSASPPRSRLKRSRESAAWPRHSSRPTSVRWRPRTLRRWRCSVWAAAARSRSHAAYARRCGPCSG